MFKLNKQFFFINQLKKDFLVDFSYKISFFGQFFGVFLTAVSFFFISETFVGSSSDHLEPFNNNYFVFATIGIAILDIIITIMRSLTTSLREAQSFGYVEILFISRTKPAYVFLCSSIYPFIKSIFKFILYIFIIQIFGSHIFSLSSILTSFFLFIVMVIPFLALSFLALSFVLYFKQSDPINFFINTVISIFSGIIYPVSVLPSSMQNISNHIPLTSQLNSARQILINNSFDDYIFSNLFYFHILFSVFFLFACIYVFNAAVYLVKKRGTIGTY
tara:strand:+ start:67 stop:891 length:825 start_codon:yes stop_codon:yes gene_type:complete